MISALFWLAHTVIQLMIWAIIIGVALSWLTNFGIVDRRNQIVYAVEDFLSRVTEPLLGPIRRHLPNFGNVDLSPLVAILLLQALQIALYRYDPSSIVISNGY